MKKNYILFLLLIAQIFANAQCNPCPNLFSISDGKGCFFGDLNPLGIATIGANYGNSDSTQFLFCGNSLSTLCINPQPVFAQGKLCEYEGFTIDSMSVNGGTLISNTANCFTVHWDTDSNAVVTIHFTIPNSNGAACRGDII